MAEDHLELYCQLEILNCKDPVGRCQQAESNDVHQILSQEFISLLNNVRCLHYLEINCKDGDSKCDFEKEHYPNKFDKGRLSILSIPTKDHDNADEPCQEIGNVDY